MERGEQMWFDGWMVEWSAAVRWMDGILWG